MIYTTNYKKLIQIIPNIEKMQVGEGLKLKSDVFMDLRINILQSTDRYLIFSMAHNYLQNGDVMADPDMEIRLLKNVGAIEALTFQNSGLGVYQKVYTIRNGKEMVNIKLKKDLNIFLKTWLTNLRKQGFNKEGKYANTTNC